MTPTLLRVYRAGPAVSAGYDALEGAEPITFGVHVHAVERPDDLVWDYAEAIATRQIDSAIVNGRIQLDNDERRDVMIYERTEELCAKAITAPESLKNVRPALAFLFLMDAREHANTFATRAVTFANAKSAARKRRGVASTYQRREDAARHIQTIERGNVDENGYDGQGVWELASINSTTHVTFDALNYTYHVQPGTTVTEPQDRSYKHSRTFTKRAVRADEHNGTPCDEHTWPLHVEAMRTSHILNGSRTKREARLIAVERRSHSLTLIAFSLAQAAALTMRATYSENDTRTVHVSSVRRPEPLNLSYTLLNTTNTGYRLAR